MNGCGMCIDSHERCCSSSTGQARDDPGGGADRRGDEGGRDGARNALMAIGTGRVWVLAKL
jgi:hypothetical protein